MTGRTECRNTAMSLAMLALQVVAPEVPHFVLVRTRAPSSIQATLHMRESLATLRDPTGFKLRTGVRKDRMLAGGEPHAKARLAGDIPAFQFARRRAHRSRCSTQPCSGEGLQPCRLEGSLVWRRSSPQISPPAACCSIQRQRSIRTRTRVPSAFSLSPGPSAGCRRIRGPWTMMLAGMASALSAHRVRATA